MTTDTAPVRCRDLRKTYTDFWGRAVHPALQGVDLVVGAGESHALLGPNGSGKTTALRILLGLMEPTGGEAFLFGRPPTDPAARRGVGFLPEVSTMHAYLTCTETVLLHASLHGVARAEAKTRAAALLDRVQLTQAAKRKVHELSLGMKRRLALAASLAGAPRLLILDEPTAGMDPIVRESVVAMFQEHVRGGGTLLVTSHLLGDISGIATRATLLAEGRVVRTGDLNEMLARAGERSYRVTVPAAGDAASVDAAVRAAAERAGAVVAESGPTRGTIEQLFLATYRGDSHRGGPGGGTKGDGNGDAGAPRGR